MKGRDDRRRDEVRYEQLILELPLPPPPKREKRVDDEERERGVVVIDLY